MKFQTGLLFCTTILGLSFLAQEIYSFDPISPDLKLVATVDGKSFFAEQNVQLNWTSAGNYCRSMGMKLASITTKAQADALQAGYNAVDFAGWHWTSGRDSQLPRQFSWNETNVAIPTEYPKFAENITIPYQTCLYYHSVAAGNSQFGAARCAGTAGVLCET